MNSAVAYVSVDIFESPETMQLSFVKQEGLVQVLSVMDERSVSGVLPWVLWILSA